MKIDTKFLINADVYLLDNNKIVKGQVIEIQTTTSGVSKTLIKYVVKIHEWGDIFRKEFRYEDELFNNIEDLKTTLENEFMGWKK